MRIFLSYPSEDHAAVEEVALALRNNRHEVFLDKDDLPPGLDYNEQIANAIAQSDLLVFFITPTSVEDGRFTRSELSFARKKWPGPAGYVLPVMLHPTPLAAVPSYLKAVQILMPQGNLVAEVRAEVERMRSRAAAAPPARKLPSFGKPLSWAAAGAIGAVALLAVYALSLDQGSGVPPVVTGSTGPEMTRACIYKQGPKAGMVEVTEYWAPLPVGSPCLDHQGSFGNFVSERSYGPQQLLDKARWTRRCRFTSGLRAGQEETMIAAIYFPIGNNCHDAAGSFGVGVRE